MQTLRGRSLLTIMTALLAGAAGGCGDVSFNVERASRRPVRPAAVPIITASRPAGALQGCEIACEPSDGKVFCYHQVVLLREPAPRDPPPGIRYVRMSRARAQDVGRLLCWLYQPCGPAGSRDRYCLVYPSTVEADAAARMALELDVASLVFRQDTPLSTDGKETFTTGIGLLLGLRPDEPLDREQMQHAVESLIAALNDLTLPNARRWIAGMLAAKAAGEHLDDREAESRHLAAAESVAQPGSLEHLATLLAQACNNEKNGAPHSSRAILARIQTHFGHFKETELFERAGRMLQDLDRRR